MNPSLATRVVVVRHAEGLHARPADFLARTAMRYSARIEIIRDTLRVDAKSILNLLTLGAGQGSELKIEAEGEDAVAAVEELARIVEGGFEEAVSAPEESVPDGEESPTRESTN
ncbi:MAG: HPr family phosphocarrier protein [Planctomycetota bacterium]